MMDTRFYRCSWLGTPVYAWLTNAQAFNAEGSEQEMVAVFEEVGGELTMYDAVMMDVVVEEQV